MKQSLAKLVDVILQQIEEHPESNLTEKGIRSWLLRKGYNQRDIEAAMKLLQPRFSNMAGAPRRVSSAVRHLSCFEAYKLTREAREALSRLEFYELIEPYEREVVLERLGQVEGEVGMDDLDYLLSWILGSTRDIESQQTMYNIFEGRTDTYH